MADTKKEKEKSFPPWQGVRRGFGEDIKRETAGDVGGHPLAGLVCLVSWYMGGACWPMLAASALLAARRLRAILARL